MSGALLAFLMEWWMNSVNYPYVSSGKPLLSLPAFIPIIFEVTVLFSAITALIAMLMFNKLPQLHHSWFSSRAFARRVTTDRFFLGIETRDAKFDPSRTRALLESTRTIGVERIEEAGSPTIPETVRRYTVPGIVVLLAIALVPPLLIAKARVTPSGNTQVLLIPDMVRQPKFLPQSFNPLFLDNRAMRPLVAGTVAVDHAYLNSFLYRGITEGEWASGFPMPLTQALVERGQARFNVYCTPCHGWDSSGQGPVAAQGQARSAETWVAPTSLLDATVRERPNGHIFNTITNGIRTMPAYGDQILPADRWAILSYVRSLQLSQAAPKALVPPERRGELR